MKYEVLERLVFNRSWKKREQVVLEPGTIVHGVHLSQMTSDDQREFKKMENTLRKSKPNARYLFFKYEGCVRAGIAMAELKPRVGL